MYNDGASNGFVQTNGSTLYLGALNATAVTLINNAAGINTGTTPPAYTLDVNGTANIGQSAGGNLTVGTSNGLLIQGYGAASSYIRADMANASSGNALYLGVGNSNLLAVARNNNGFMGPLSITGVGPTTFAGYAGYSLDVSGTGRYVTNGTVSTSAWAGNSGTDTLAIMTNAATGVNSNGVASILFANSTQTNFPYGRIATIDQQVGAGAYASAMIFQTNGGGVSLAERMRIHSNGNVGIGTSAPAYTLDVIGNSRFYVAGEALRCQYNNAVFRVRCDANNYAGVYMNGYFTVGQQGTDNNTIFFTVPSDASQPAWYSNGSGNFGIGTKAPAYTLDVSGGARVTSNMGVGVAPLATAGTINVSTGFYINGVAVGGGGATISGTTTSGTVLLATGTSTGIQGNANMSFASEVLTISNSASGNTSITLIGLSGTNAGSTNFGIAGGANNFISGSATGDACLRACNRLHFASGSSGNTASFIPGITVSNTFVGINNTGAPATALDVNGGVTIRNGFRPLYNYFTGSGPITPSITSYGTHYYIINSAVTGITIPAPIITTDTNAHWVFRNATGSYLSITVTWPTQYYPTAGGTLTTFSPAVFPTTSFIPIPPQNAITIMFAWTSGGNQGSYCFAGPGTGVGSNLYAVF